MSRIVILALLLTGPIAARAETHPFQVRDLVALDRLSDVQLSPDGKQLAFVVREADLEANQGLFDIWTIGSDGRGLRRLTSHVAPDRSPRWAPDGSALYFLSSRAGSNQVWRIDPQGGEAVQVSRLAVEVEEIMGIAGPRLLLALSVYPHCQTLACTIEREAAEKKRKSSGRLFDRLFVRQWDTWKSGKRSHLFSWAAGESEPRDLTAGLDADVPMAVWGGPEEVALSPDGKEVVYSVRLAGREEAWSTDFNLYQVPLDGSRAPVCLTCDNPAWDTRPVFSPDGKSLAYLAMSRPGYESDRFEIRLRDRASGQTRAVAPGWDRSPQGLVWSADGRRLFAVADALGQTALFAVTVADGRTAALAAQGSSQMPQVGRDRLYFLHDDLQHPAELHSLRLDDKDARVLTHFNDERLARVRLGEPVQFHFAGAHGDQVYAYLVKPVDFDPGKRYPVAVLIHGGPQGSFGNHFHYRWNPQTYAGAGIAALAIDFHGSTGYGQKFTDSIRGDWGGAPYQDVLKGLDAATQQFPFLDGQRACALGASYGGFLVNWIAGQTDRFRCLVTHDGNLDERFAYFATEELWFPEWEHGGTPWENPAGYARHNPIDHVAKWKTPMLIVHGGLDYRVVDTEGLAAFNVLQRRGIPSQLLYFPDENHWVLKPHNSILWHDTVLGWLAQWLR